VGFLSPRLSSAAFRSSRVGGGLFRFPVCFPSSSKSGSAGRQCRPGRCSLRYWLALRPGQHCSTESRFSGTDVRLENSTLTDAHLPDESADIVYSISTIEHIPVCRAPRAPRNEIRRILRPGGKVVLTIDLFLDLSPFHEGASRTGSAGTSTSGAFVEALGFEKVLGDEREPQRICEFRFRVRCSASCPSLLYGNPLPSMRAVAHAREALAPIARGRGQLAVRRAVAFTDSFRGRAGLGRQARRRIEWRKGGDTRMSGFYTMGDANYFRWCRGPRQFVEESPDTTIRSPSLIWA